MEERQKILDNIIEIHPGVISDIKIEFSDHHNKYGIILNGKHLSKRDKIFIKYRCVNCKAIHTVSPTQFIRKINKCSYKCELCSQDANTSHIELSFQDKIQNSLDEFDTYDDDFKNNYFKYHLTLDDYSRISKSLVSLHNGKFIIKENIQYYPIFKQSLTGFISIFYDKNDDTVIKAYQPMMQCQECNTIWRAKSLEKFKNCHKILCKECVTCSQKRLRFKYIKNNINEQIMYQTQMEYRFINWCNRNNITIKNDESIGQYRVKNMSIKVRNNNESCKDDKTVIILNPKNWVLCLNMLLKAK